MKPTVIAVVGGKKSGKTTAIEILTRELVNRGYRVASVKHIPEPSFTIDKEGKDTWRYVRAGAQVVIGASANEIATIERLRGKDVSLEEVLSRSRESEIVFLEGFRQLVAKARQIYKIVVAKSADEVTEAVEMFDPILTLTGPYRPEKLGLKTPYFDVFKDAKKIADLIEKLVIGEAAT